VSRAGFDDVLDDREFELAARRLGPVGDQLRLEAVDEALSNAVDA
jgi:hypothetical protein